MYRFALRPRWIAAHVLILAVASAFVSLGVWQLNRLREQQARDLVVSAVMRMPPVAVDDAEPYNRVRASGVYDTADEMLLFGRAFDGRPGHHVLTWLDPAGARPILVDRGWVPYENGSAPVRAAQPPSGTVDVRGLLVPSERRGVVNGRRTTAINVAKLASARGVESIPYYVLLERQDPPQSGRLPRPVPLRATKRSPPHLAYAIQWFSFATIGLIGYGAVLRRAARRET